MIATNLASSSLCKPGSIGRSDGLPVAAAAATTVRFGVAFRLLSAFAAITIFAIATSIIALYTFGKYRNGFNRIASSSLPALVAASNLAQRSQALAANAPNLAVADGHFARRAVSEALRSQLQAIAEAGEQVKELAPAPRALIVSFALRLHSKKTFRNWTSWWPRSWRPIASQQIYCCGLESFPFGFKLPSATCNANGVAGT